MWPVAFYNHNAFQNSTTKRKFQHAVFITDNTGNYAGLKAEIKGVEACVNEIGWVTLLDTTQMVQVLQLIIGKEMLLGIRADSTSYKYSKLKITFGEKNLLAVKRKIGMHVEEKIYTLKYDGTPEVVMDFENLSSPNILLDFNIAQSIFRLGDEYALKPVINLINDVKTGVRGKFAGSVNVAVCVYDDKKAYSTYANAKGEFLIHGLDENDYNLTIISQNEFGKLPEKMEPQIKEVTVIQGQIIQLGKVEV